MLLASTRASSMGIRARLLAYCDVDVFNILMINNDETSLGGSSKDGYKTFIFMISIRIFTYNFIIKL